MDSQNKWNDLIIKAILLDKDVDVKEVNNFERVQSLIFDSEKKNGSNEYLDIIKFSDQNHKNYSATIYDNDELWQVPQIIDIITLT